MTFEQLLTVEAVIKAGSFKGASALLHKSQPSISMSIKNLEEEFGILIFSRENYRPILTKEGKVFLEKMKETLQQFRELENLGKYLGNGHESEIAISIDAISPVPLVLKFLQKFFHRHKNTRLKIFFEVLNGTIEKLVDRDVDFAISFMPEHQFLEGHFESVYLSSVRMVPVIESGLYHNLLKLHGVKSLNDEILKNETQIILSDSARHLRKIDSGVMPFGKSMAITDLTFKKEMISKGLGYGSLPMELIKKDQLEKKLKKIKTRSVFERDVKIYVHRNANQNLGPVGKELWAQFQEKF